MALPLILLHCALRHYAFCQAEPMDSIVWPWKILVSLVELLNSLLNSLLNWNLFKCKIVRSEYVQPWHWLIGFLMSWLIVESKFGQLVFGELTICWKSTIVEVGFVLTDLSPLRYFFKCWNTDNLSFCRDHFKTCGLRRPTWVNDNSSAKVTTCEC